MAFSFSTKRALVTGCGKGVGRDVVKRLIDCGAEVIAVTRTQSDLDELSKYSDKIKPVLLDIGNWDATKSELEKVGPVDLLVNNAGIYTYKLFGEISEKDFDDVFNINTKAVLNISQIVAAGMIKRGVEGSIVNVSSISSFRASTTALLYGSSKAALDQLTRSMAHELGPHKIRVNAVSPGPVRTHMTEMLFQEGNEHRIKLEEKTPLLKLGEAKDITYPILFLLSEHASHITGITMPVDGGISNVY